MNFNLYCCGISKLYLEDQNLMARGYEFDLQLESIIRDEAGLCCLSIFGIHFKAKILMYKNLAYPITVKT